MSCVRPYEHGWVWEDVNLPYPLYVLSNWYLIQFPTETLISRNDNSEYYKITETKDFINITRKIKLNQLLK